MIVCISKSPDPWTIYTNASKAYIAQTPHLPSHAESTRLGTDNPRSETNEHADGIAHRKLLARTERSYNAQIDALERRRIRHARAPRTKRKEHRRRRDNRGSGGGGSKREDADELIVTDDNDADDDA